MEVAATRLVQWFNELRSSAHLYLPAQTRKSSRAPKISLLMYEKYHIVYALLRCVRVNDGIVDNRLGVRADIVLYFVRTLMA